jgi:guanylate kinase
MIGDGNDLLFDLDVQGVDSFKKHFNEKAQSIFIAPPSLEELEKRLMGRGTDSVEVIQERLKNSQKEMLRKDDYDFCLTNDDLERAYTELKNIITKILES